MQKIQGVILLNTPISVDNCPSVANIDIKVMLQHSTFTLWTDMKTNLFEYS